MLSLSGIGDLIHLVLQILSYAIFVHVILSWIPDARHSKFGVLLEGIVEPILAPIRKVFSKFTQRSILPIDLSPLIALLLINVAQMMVRTILR
jgi:YggT family protein